MLDALILRQDHANAVAITAVQARAGDYLSRIAWIAGLSYEQFMLDNVDNVKDLDASLQGKKLRVCNPAQGERQGEQLPAWNAQQCSHRSQAWVNVVSCRNEYAHMLQTRLTCLSAAPGFLLQMSC